MGRRWLWFGVFLGAIVLLASPAPACKWDYDTIRDERRGLPGIGEVLAGRFEKHSKFFYEQRIVRMKALLKSQPKNLDAWDNLAAAYETLGDHDTAIATILEKDKIAPDQYTTYANLGTFYLHKGDLENGIAAIRRALEINPDAHFGREEYQLKLALYYRDAKKSPELLKRESFLEHAGVIPAMSTTQPARHDSELYGRVFDGYPAGANLKPNAFDGIVGMIRFGPGDSAELYLALGDLLAYRGDSLLAYRAYQRALDYKHPRVEYLRAIMQVLEERIYYKDQISAETIAKERAQAAAWVKSYQDFEDDLVRRGLDTEDAKNYEPFYAKHGTATIVPTISEEVGDWFRHNQAILIFSGVVFVLFAPIVLLVWWMRRRRMRRIKSSIER